MPFDAQILADSQHPSEPSRLVTMQLTYPRIIHAEFMTHRQFSRNAASSRAIPCEKMLEEIKRDPFIPIEWGTNQKGMVAGAPHTDPAQCESLWLSARDYAVRHATRLHRMGIHKQTVNRIVEPWMWITVITTGVDHAWENFFKLRCVPDAEPHIQKIAYLARQVFDNHTPTVLRQGEHHLPLTGFPGDEKLDAVDLVKVSVARCARVSYLTHDGRRDPAADIAMYDRLKANGHWSPFEHVALPLVSEPGVWWTSQSNFGPFWVQHRKQYVSEYCRRAPRDAAQEMG